MLERTHPRDVTGRGRAARRAAGGALDGGAATIVMSAAMLVARRAGWLGRAPPATITEHALDGVGAREVPERAVDALAAGAHLAFGAAAGALFRLVRRGPRGRRLAFLEGAAYGAAIWVVSYAGWIPALGILPMPQRDRPGRPAAMFLAHLVFGGTLGLLAERRRGPFTGRGARPRRR